VQGIGAGGLIVLTQATIGDIVSPRERGKYQGIFGGVFGLASVAGPLLGGLIVEHTSWRWVFYVNLPVGLVALVVLALTLPATAARARPSIDYVGAGLLAAGLSAIVLVTSLGGTTWDWGSTQAVLVALLGVGALVAFAQVERRVAEPVLPPALWRERVFAVGSGLSLIVGFALFGAVTFLPLYFQTVDAASPSESGLRLLPLMLGLLTTSIASGQIISRVGRYKVFPVLGTAVMTVGLLLLSRLQLGTSTATSSLYLLVLGLGLGMVMQVLVLAVQNAVRYEVLGAATSGVTLMRGVGGSLGTAAFGAIFTNRLTSELSGSNLPDSLRAIVSGGGRLTGSQVERLPGAARMAYEQGYVDALTPVFAVAAGVAAVGFLVSWLLPERPLRTTMTSVDETFAAPTASDSLAEAERLIVCNSDRAERERFRERMAQRAGIDLSPGATWALVRIEEHDVDAVRSVAEEHGATPERIAEVSDELRARGLLGEDGLTEQGHASSRQLLTARRDLLADVVDEPGRERPPELQALVERLARDLVGEPP
jgi:EmrB/QacA subfamily drug resistance transporter